MFIRTINPIKLLRIHDNRARYGGISKTTFYGRMKEGLIPPPISLFGRSVAWLEHETDQVIAAMAAGKSKDEIKTLVLSLIEQRQELLENYNGTI